MSEDDLKDYQLLVDLDFANPHDFKPEYPSQLENLFTNWGTIELKRQLALNDVYHVRVYQNVTKQLNANESSFHVCKGDAVFLALVNSIQREYRNAVFSASKAPGYYDLEKLKRIPIVEAFRIDFWRGACATFLRADCWTQFADFEVVYQPKGLRQS